MKSAYVICILLSITISSLALDNTDGKIAVAQTHIGEIQASNVSSKSETTITSPPSSTTSSTHSSTEVTTASTSTTTNKTTTIPDNTSTTAVPTPTSTTTTTIPTTTTQKTTTAIPTSSVKPSTVISSSSAPEAPTTAVPSPSKDRHFDGLSFFGGIILATCLMAIAVFSWKFYRQCNQENYRTL